jgi:Family of unknown function (DUF5309)
VPPFMGLRGSRSYDPDATPKNWREGILRLYPNGGPNGGAVLTAFLALIDAERTSDPEFNWWERPLPLRHAATTGAQLTSDTSLTIQAVAGEPTLGKIFRKGYIVINTRTKEHMLVTADQTVATTVVVQRAYGETAAAAMNALDELRVIGNANEEGGPLPTPVAYDPTKQFNYTQIFRTPLHVTRTALKTRLRTESAIMQAQIEALELQAMDIEEAFLFGERYETTGANGMPSRTTRGMQRWIEALAPGNAVVAGATTTEEQFLGMLEPMYRYGSIEKLWLVGSHAATVITRLAKLGSQINLEAGDEVYGIRLHRFVTALGDGYLRLHPLFNLYADWRSMLMVIDLEHIRYRYVDDIGFYDHRQSPGDDALKSEWLCEAGLEVNHAQVHGLVSNLTAAAAS